MTTSASTPRRPGCSSRARVIETVADFLEGAPSRSSSTRSWSRAPARRCCRATRWRRSCARLFPLATVVTPNLHEAEALAGSGSRRELAERIHELGAAGGRRDGRARRRSRWTISSTASATSRSPSSATTRRPRTVRAAPIRPRSLRAWPGDCPSSEAAREAARVASDAVRHGLAEIGAGDGPVDVLHLKGAA